MNDKNLRNICIAGTGNVASHLARAVAAGNHRLAGIFSRHAAHAAEAAASYGCMHGEYSRLAQAKPDIVIVSVADSGIADTVNAIGKLPDDTIVLHTSGTVSMDALAPVSPRHGILYPLQSFTKNADVHIDEVPFFTEASDEETLAAADALAQDIGARAYHADENVRRTLHIAGVMTNNFVNILLLEAQRLLEAKGIGPEAIRPLAEMTVRKAFAMTPRQAQTGPARRGDTEVIESQYNALPEHLRPAYRELTNLILKEFQQ